MKFINLKTRRLLAVTFILLLPLFANAQTKPLVQLVDETMQLRRQKNYWKGLSPFRSYIKDSAQAMINAFMPYVNDSIEEVRSLAYTAVAITGQKTDIANLRKEAVSTLVGACSDKEPALRKNVARQLENYNPTDFTEDSRKKLSALLSMEQTFYRHTVKLIGFLQMKDQIPTLQNLLNSEEVKNQTLRWDIRLTLARLGQEKEINYCVDFAKGLGLNDKVIYNIFPDLAYMRTQEATDYMIEVLNSDEKNCYSPNPDNPVKIACAYRVMEFLAPIIIDFPLPTDKYDELDVDDYEKALQTLRSWFQEHMNDYQLDEERF